MKTHDALYNVRHSAAHLLAQAVLELFPGTLLTIGPVTEDGFFYDFLPPKNFKESDLKKIEKMMRRLAKKNHKIEGKTVSKDEARKLFKDNKFKLELIDEIEDEEMGIFSQGDFFDLCAGGHVESTGKVEHFQLTAISGSYWRADRDGQALQRIRGIAFETAEQLDDYLKRIEEAKLSDHRTLGKQLDLFTFHDEAAGSVFFHDKGTFLYNALINFMRDKIKNDYQEVKTPMILHEKLWKTSGHYDNYKENMYFTKVDEATHCVRPMNCPGGILIYNEKPHSYRELPLRMAEFGLVYRHELSGVLHGLFRVRSFTQDDAHSFCTEDQIKSEIVKMLELSKATYDVFNFKNVTFAVATRPEKAMGEERLWDKATVALKSAMDELKIPYNVKEGEGAFYGPKIEINIEDTMGRQWQCGTIQVDFFLPENFNLEYIDSDQKRKRPVMIHRAILGSIERFLGILVEHYKGKFPLWLAPIQARVLTISEKQHDYGQQIFNKLRESGLRVDFDTSDDKISGKIKRAQLEQLPWMIVIGGKEAEAGTVTLRHRDGKQEFGLSVDELIKRNTEQQV
jgi:threonyl-tRNA synthetase